MLLLLFDLFHELHQENVKWCILYVVSKRLVLQKVVKRLRSYVQYLQQYYFPTVK